ncbi:MAG: hypothetical protein V2I82_07325, partial [Halieaceae bacterium]|nr:hypothetical protein [Halieaceae bacterium]
MSRGLCIVAALLLAACGAKTPEERLDGIATRYVALAMDLDRVRPGEIDAWFGPDALDTRGEPTDSTFEAIRLAARELGASFSELATARAEGLRDRIRGLEAIAAYLEDPTRLNFAEQTQTLYDVPWIEADAESTRAALAAIEEALPGRGSARARVAGLRRRLLIPAEKRQAVFEAALEECRERTLARWDLPDGEAIDLEWTRDVMAAWHSYVGDGRSTLRVNPLAIATVDQAVDVACHEAWPGHHVQFVLFEAAAGDAGLALEDRLVLLRTPASALREAAAMVAARLAFTDAERLAFERDALFPMAGLDPADAERYAAVRPQLRYLATTVPSIIRDHEDGQLSDAEAINRLQGEALIASPRALFAFA